LYGRAVDNRQEQNPYDKQVGQNLQLLRAQSALTQVGLAGLLKAAGTPLSQQTIVKIEQGTRPLRLEEAQQIAAVLGVDITTLTTPIHHLAAQIARETSLATYAAEEAVEKAENWNVSRAALAFLLQNLEPGAAINPDVLARAEEASRYDLGAALTKALSRPVGIRKAGTVGSDG
jgi:transcriptional regulator with XRE-family HTH domain